MLDATPALILRASCSRLLRRFQSQPLRHLGAEADVEVGFADPHAMQDTGELTRDRDDRAQHARSLGDPKTPRPQCRPLPDPQQKACGRLAQRFPDIDVALLGDAPLIVDRGAGLMSPGRQAKMRSNRSRPGKAQGIIHANLERERSNRTDARNRHQAAADRIVLNHLQQHSVQSFVARRRSLAVRPAWSRSSSRILDRRARSAPGPVPRSPHDQRLPSASHTLAACHECGSRCRSACA